MTLGDDTSAVVVIENKDNAPLTRARLRVVFDNAQAHRQLRLTLSGLTPVQVQEGYEWPVRPLAAKESRKEELTIEALAAASESLKAANTAPTLKLALVLPNCQTKFAILAETELSLLPVATSGPLPAPPIEALPATRPGSLAPLNR